MAKAKDGNIAELKQDERNANRHKERGKELLQKSMHELGAGRSVLVDANNVLIAGNNSTETAIAEGITKTVVVETTGDTLVVVKRTDLDLNDPGESGRKARQMALVDNASALAGIDFDIEAVQEIEEQWGFEAVDWGVEFPDEEVIAPAAEEDDYQPKEEVFTNIVPGDIFEFIKGNIYHRLMCGDSTDSDAVTVLMNGKIANMVFTDPPHEVEQENFISYMDLFCNGVKFVLHNDRYLAQLAAQYIDRFERFFVHDFILHIGGGSRFFSQTDLIACFDFDSSIYNNLFDGFSTLIRKMGERQKGTENLPHPHAKPVYLVEQFITHFSNEGALVLDFYGGSGTTMATAHQLNRNCYMMELNEKTAQVIVDRMKALDPEIKIIKNGVPLA